jgi:hypothetical protein
LAKLKAVVKISKANVEESPKHQALMLQICSIKLYKAFADNKNVHKEYS